MENMSLKNKKWLHRGLNSGPSPYESDVLPLYYAAMELEKLPALKRFLSATKYIIKEEAKNGDR